MKYSLPTFIAATVCCAGVAVRGQSPGAATASPAIDAKFSAGRDDIYLRPLRPPAPSELIERAAALPACKSSLIAKVRVTADVGGRWVDGSGRYVQASKPSLRTRYELRFQVNDFPAQRLEVNDGRYLWRRTQFDAEPDIERLDIERFLAARRAAGSDVDGDVGELLALGGIGRILATFHSELEFYEVFPFNLTGRSVFGIEGRWREEALNRHGVDSAEQLLPHVPDRVTVYLGVDDLFPYRIEYYRAGKGQGRSGAAPPYLSLEFDAVQFDAAVDGAEFQLDPVPTQFVDVTERAILRRK